MHCDLKPLEFGAIQRSLERLALTPYGAQAARELVPAPEPVVARTMQRSVGAARLLVDAGSLPRLEAVPDVRAALRQAGQPGAALSAQALHNLRRVLATAAALGRLAAQHEGLAPHPGQLQPPQALQSRLDAVLTEAGRVREDASPQLAALHGELHAARAAAEKALHARAGHDDLASAEDGRVRVQWQGPRGVLLLPQVLADRVKGVRRGSAGGGRDALVEPVEAMAANNRLETLSGRMEAEVQQVLRAVTAELAGELQALHRLLDALTWVDLALAAGRLSAAMNAAPPELVDQPVLDLDRAYHPLLLLQFAERQIERLVPLTLRLADDQPLLVITGPNTGGKTVVLKTVGLLVSMAHCGLHIPSEGFCRIGAFTRVVVDVGDPQSLYHHLSTFAGHVEVLKRLLAEADARTLVLLDELGTGTDPEEGAALSMAVLEELAGRRVHGVVTTHLPPLKAFADATPGLCNASMRFDYEALAPTYELEPGRAGVSLGLLVAEKRGLEPALVARAREHLDRIRPAAGGGNGAP